MLRFVINQWRRQRGKFILTLVGALIISAGLSLMFNLTDSSQGTVEQTLQKKWSSAYDIVVRPKGSQMTTESNNLLEPNYLNGINGGISFKQYQQIKQMNEIDIAAPVAVMGYANIGISIPNQIHFPDEPGIYRLSNSHYGAGGFSKELIAQDGAYFSTTEEPLVPPNTRLIHLQDPKGFSSIQPFTYSLIVGIDPEAEAQLVGLDKSILNKKKFRYFNQEDVPSASKESSNQFDIPVLINPKSFNTGYSQFMLEQVNVDLKTKQARDTFYQRLAKSNAPQPLDQEKRKIIQDIKVDASKVESAFFDSFLGQKTKSLSQAEANTDAQLVAQTGSLTYQTVKSPFPTRWENAYEVHTAPTTFKNTILSSSYLPKHGFRTVDSYEIKMKKSDGSAFKSMNPYLTFNVVGLYDPNKINVSKDPLNELPMETYRPSAASIVLDSKNEPVNPAQPINTTGNPIGLLTNSPNVLTTVDSVKKVMGDQSISSIRLKVKGASSVGEQSDKTLQRIKSEIERKTGHIATITKGSSPQPVVTKVVDDGKTLGWIEQPWIHIGAAMTIFRETSVGFSGVIFAMLAVAIVYVLATSYVSMLARRKEFAVLLALGWRTKDLYKIVLIEAAILAGFVSTIALIVEGIFSLVRSEAMNGWSLLWIALFSLVIYLAGAAWSAWTIRRISPYEVIKTGEYAKAARVGLKLRSTMTLALKELIGKWKRNSLSVLSIALPTALLTFFLFVTFHLQGVLYTSWLGQFVALQVGPMHYVTMGVAITIAILTTGEIMWQNVTDRRASLAVLKALGWTNGAIRQLIVIEGFLVGLISGVIGLIVAYTTIYVLYDLVPWNEPLLIGVSLALPILFGVIAAFIPAQLAARVQPYQELKDAS